MDMSWQLEEDERRKAEQKKEKDHCDKKALVQSEATVAVSDFWLKLEAANEEILIAVRAGTVTRWSTIPSLKGRDGCNIYLVNTNTPDNEPFISNWDQDPKSRLNINFEGTIRYSHEKKQLILWHQAHGSVQITDRHIELMLKNICTGHDYWEGLV